MLYTRSLGHELTKELRASLEKNPRPYLFTESNSARRYTHSGFAMYARRTLHKLFGKPCTLTLLRHSYISHMLAYGQLTIRDREQLAAEMCHSPATQAQYQWFEPRQTGKGRLGRAIIVTMEMSWNIVVRPVSFLGRMREVRVDADIGFVYSGAWCENDHRRTNGNESL